MDLDNGQFDYTSDDNQLSMFEDDIAPVVAPSASRYREPILEHGKVYGPSASSHVVRNVKKKGAEEVKGSVMQFAFALLAAVIASAMNAFVLLKLFTAGVDSAPIVALVVLACLLLVVSNILGMVKNSARSAFMSFGAGFSVLWCVVFIDLSFGVVLIAYKFAAIPLIMGFVSILLGSSSDNAKPTRSFK